MARMASAGGMLPEQVWDSAPIPARGLALGRPTGAAMPLVWAHAEYLKLAASRELKRPFDRPAAVWARYRGERPPLKRLIWTEQAPLTQLPEGCALTIALRAPGVVRCGVDGWADARDQETRPNALGLHLVEIDTPRLRAGRTLDFTYRSGGEWAGQDFQVRVVPRAATGG
jgi:glucoamylase